MVGTWSEGVQWLVHGVRCAMVGTWVGTWNEGVQWLVHGVRVGTWSEGVQWLVHGVRVGTGCAMVGVNTAV